ncbi:hypothetical protein [Paenibacillus eucommiae]|uniref:Beta-galactosidase trimerisation domain-containing protein n=1 Tax=Paenibacillus eucommiae TaxID=1355755 RepID=A0ABS4J1V8_9BACL|nr:hypothetical protein [Paenibacillus eucommiae]MBP1993812.1 hypothetical protein [Paenibacillus eucommiae]
MKIHYSLDSAVALDPAKQPILQAMQSAGVGQIWLHGYFFGHMASPVSDMVKARELLQTYGFDVGVINVPIGHPGNSANPDDPDMDFSLPSHWRYRVDRHGNFVYFCADMESGMLRDSVQAMEELRDAGFTQVLMDDDLRQGNWGPEIEGCYCEACILEFNETRSRAESRESLKDLVESGTVTDVLKEWVAFYCSKVTEYLAAMAIPGIEVGTMIMPDGDERHGLDVAAIREAVPDCLFRVGEYQYNDETFGSPLGKALEYISALKHLNWIDRKRAYSETTVFPNRALSADNLVLKGKMAIALGIPNIMLMSGTCVIEEDYWKVWQDSLADMEEIDRQCYPYERAYPVHLLYGTHGVYQEPMHPSPLPVLAGLPVKPVRAHEGDRTGEVLCVFGDYLLGEEWEQLLPSYKQVIFDQAAARKNPDKVAHPSYPQVLVWEHVAGTASSEDEVSMLRQIIARSVWDFPWTTDGGQVGLIWLKENKSIILTNLENEEVECRITYNGRVRDVVMTPLSFQVLQW